MKRNMNDLSFSSICTEASLENRQKVRQAKSESPSLLKTKNQNNLGKSNFCPNNKPAYTKSNTFQLDFKSSQSKTQISQTVSPRNFFNPQSAKLNNIINSIEKLLVDEHKQTEQLVSNINRQVTAINQKFDKKQVSNKKADNLLFTEGEQKELIEVYNQSVKNMYTSKSSGMNYFKQKILKQTEELN
ncbi:hypothetical protein TTHERM_00992950 (macronuclear) [Tetrahymena thermophila SB210]|uniref:Uncharacterized protein n=1 Tax=Tetrahymena thermophila (strain SB210) TaxID=312017 RepID=Q22DA8_TETTS|nr:hypothetical protein TTHERM_00992950 [Tetrahymena thermophila SB210]EAR83294.2 hypothetical protein TTHERM_00992950 [Tetrahymena thermophila SB210]|eukprot:XP_001030957.2 hypothetical protein TTHERM_00992950 [Tetrahymena thermophila SB210]